MWEKANQKAFNGWFEDGDGDGAEPEFDKPFSVETFASGRDLDRLRTTSVGDAIGK